MTAYPERKREGEGGREGERESKHDSIKRDQYRLRELAKDLGDRKITYTLNLVSRKRNMFV